MTKSVRTRLQVDVSRETGEVILLIETGCGLRPVMAWPSPHDFGDFTERLLSISTRINGSKDSTEKIP